MAHAAQSEPPLTTRLDLPKPGPTKLDARMPTGQALVLMARQALAHIQAKQAGIADQTDPEPIHQMRVGMRRLRAATGLLARWAPCPPGLLSELAWLDGELGATRDAEVLAGQALPAVAKACPQEPGLRLLQRQATALAKARRRLTARALTSVRHSRLMQGLDAWLRALAEEGQPGQATAPQALARPLARQLKVVLALRRRKLSQQGQQLDENDPASRHRLRIAVKKARYTFDFFQSMVPGGRLKKDLRHLAVLQDTLGRLNDVAVAGRMLHDIAERHPESSSSASFARGFLAAAAIPDAQALKGLCRRFVSVD
jgi:triphosphatase